MRVLHITEACGGGVLRHLELLCPALAECGVESCVYAFSARAEQDFPERILSSLPSSAAFRLDSYPAWRFPLNAPLLMHRIRQTAAFFKPDLIHLHAFWAGCLGRLALPDYTKLYSPHAFSWHSSAPHLRNAVVVNIEKALQRQTAAYLFVGKQETDFAVRFGLDLCKCSVIPNGLPADFSRSLLSREEARQRLGISPDERSFVFPSRMTWQKGFDILLKACVKSQEPFIVHIFGGDAPVDRRFRKRLWNCLDAGRVILHPATRELPTLLRAFDGALFPSRYEGCSYSLLECLEAGLPVAVSQGALSGLVGGHPNLHVIQPCTPLNLAGAVLECAGLALDCEREPYTVQTQAARLSKEYLRSCQMFR